MIAPGCNFNQLIQTFIESSKDGYAIFCPDDKLLYANYVFLDIFCATNCKVEYWSFEQLVRHAYDQKRGINIETDHIESWLEYVRSVRRKRPHRMFEVDLVNGRWMLFSEHLLDSGELLLQAKDISKQKVTESTLQRSLVQLKKLALTDELTQLANRRSFVDAVETELARVQRNQASATMLVIDLDHFKRINDTYGHLAGDHVLKHTAAILRQSTRQYDIVGRLGGEEFAVFMSEADLNVAYEVAERIRSSLAQSVTEVDGNSISVTASIGICTKLKPDSFETLFTDADEALYKAKSDGRNRIAVFNTLNRTT
ncbi:GGDEF domain-containing protein [Alteromonas sp. KC3]|uniref:GGDEF domain-containing protein n=1 Tax=unclassified Alteromonas TaxID=2614992 RepID=UPI001923C32F|nr:MULTISPECIES: GGDEF domain-containing protein [unclassified Alteromonas]BCO18650.1 GGDEF domain-containing protein [Alteromonas sp. KC3]BCO22611.1 GGDEF domain-containing protein [Alteromonas sp. KC14]